MKHIIKTETYFYDIKGRVSSTGYNLSRGVYLRHTVSGEDVPVWTDMKGNILEMENWGKILEEDLLQTC